MGRKGRQTGPDNAPYQLTLGNAYASYVNEVSIFSKLHVAHEIRDAYKAAVKLDPDNAEARYYLAMYYMKAPGIAGGSDDKAAVQLAALDRIDPATADLLRMQKANGADHHAAAEKFLRKSAAEAKNSDGYVSLAAYLASRKDYEGAVTALQTATQKYPDEPAAWYQLGKLAAEGHADADKGIQAMQNYLDMRIDWMDGDAPLCWAHYRLGQIYARVGHNDKAEGQYRKAAKLTPGFKPAQQALDKLTATQAG